LEARNKANPFRTFVVLLSSFLLLAVMFLLPALPQIYPESEIIQTFLGRGKFVVFWLIIIGCLLIGVIWEQQKINRERDKHHS
jgi:hypothetical protein